MDGIEVGACVNCGTDGTTTALAISGDLEFVLRTFSGYAGISVEEAGELLRDELGDVVSEPLNVAPLLCWPCARKTGAALADIEDLNANRAVRGYRRTELPDLRVVYTEFSTEVCAVCNGEWELSPTPFPSAYTEASLDSPDVPEPVCDYCFEELEPRAFKLMLAERQRFWAN